MHNPLKELRVTISRTILFLDWVDTSGEIVEDKILGQVISYFDEATPCADKEIVSSKTAAKCMSLFSKSTAEQSKYSKKSIQIAKEVTCTLFWDRCDEKITYCCSIFSRTLNLTPMGHMSPKTINLVLLYIVWCNKHVHEWKPTMKILIYSLSYFYQCWVYELFW